MSIKINVPDVTELKPRITVIGVGGAGGNAINNMIATGLSGVDFIAANTDAQALAMSSADHRLQMGVNLTEGLGAGSHPEIGEAAAQEAIEEIKAQIAGSHMVFVACGMGGGTGTGAAPIIASVAKEQKILTVGVVTKPFEFEGKRRMRAAEEGIVKLRSNVDTLIVIPNQNLFRIATEKTTFADAFKLADQVLHAGIACITDLILKDGLINLDFADVRTVMKGMGTAMMGTGEALGDRRAIQAAEEAISNPLLDNITLRGAKGLLISITGGSDLTLYEVDEAASRISQDVDKDANIIVGATHDHGLDGKIRVSIVASGVDLSEERYISEPKATDFISGKRDYPDEKPSDKRIDIGLEVKNLAGKSTAPEKSALRNREDWSGPEDVAIEKRTPNLRASTTHSVQDKLRDDRGDDGSFVPGPPTSIKRQPRAMPTVEDFPEIVQKEFRTKRGFDHKEASKERRKLGFFERLASVGRATVSTDSQYEDKDSKFREYETGDLRRSRLSLDEDNVNRSKSDARGSRFADDLPHDKTKDSKKLREESDEISVNIEIPDFLRREV